VVAARSPRRHRRLAEVVLEGSVGGRWIERGVDGSECEWGRVLEWNPPNAIALAWYLNADFKPDPSKASRIDVRFVAEGAGSTRVELEHSDLDRVGERWPTLLAEISAEGGWPTLLELFTKAAAA
jgi:hypothetical protein